MVNRRDKKRRWTRRKMKEEGKYSVSGGEEKQRRKRMKMFEEQKYFQRKKRSRIFCLKYTLLSNLLGFINDREDTAL